MLWTIIAAPAIVAAGTPPSAARSAPAAADAFSSEAQLSTGEVPAGDAISITATLSAASDATVLINIEVMSPAGDQIFQQWFDNQYVPAGGAWDHSVVCQLPETEAPGTYVVRIGAYDPGWGPVRHWNGDAASFVVTPPAGGAAPGALPPAPARWPGTLPLGMADAPGGAGTMRAVGAFNYRYHYLAGGVNTGKGWASWQPDGGYVTSYIQESVAAGITPVFSYYQMRESAPGAGMGEADGDYANLQNADTMAAYYTDLRRFFQRAGGFPNTTVVLHVEPDLWAYMHQRAGTDDASAVPARVAATGAPELAGLPDTLAGFAQAITRLRDAYAPNVLLAYHWSSWSTGVSVLDDRVADATAASLGARAGRFYLSLGANFDLVFAQSGILDAGYLQYVRGDGGASWWSAATYHRDTVMIGAFVRTAGKRVVLWQIPVGNTKTAAMTNGPHHYQDNHVEWWLDDPGRDHLRAYVDAGVIGLLFGPAEPDSTCACDPATGSLSASPEADADGGYFRQHAADYVRSGALPLP